MALLPNCKEVHRLVSEGLDRELSGVETARMRVHFWMCRACTNFNGQMMLIRRAMHAMPAPEVEPAPDDEHKST